MVDLISSVIAAYGGLDRWRTVRAIDVTFNFSGWLLDLKGYPGHRRPSASVDAATPRTVFQRLGDDSDDRWIFTANRAWIERRDGTIVEERSDLRGLCGACTRDALGSPAPDLFSWLRGLGLSDSSTTSSTCWAASQRTIALTT
jgi:hypothetical protein